MLWRIYKGNLQKKKVKDKIEERKKEVFILKRGIKKDYKERRRRDGFDVEFYCV